MAVAYHVRDSPCNRKVNTPVIFARSPMEAVDTLASRLRKARDQRELSQPALARLAGVSQGTIGNIEAGIRGGASSLAMIAAALQIRYEWLRDGEGPMELPAAYWPFETVDLARFEALSERQKGRVEQALADALSAVEADSEKRKVVGG